MNGYDLIKRYGPRGRHSSRTAVVEREEPKKKKKKGVGFNLDFLGSAAKWTGENIFKPIGQGIDELGHTIQGAAGSDPYSQAADWEKKKLEMVKRIGELPIGEQREATEKLEKIEEELLSKKLIKTYEEAEKHGTPEEIVGGGVKTASVIASLGAGPAVTSAYRALPFGQRILVGAGAEAMAGGLYGGGEALAKKQDLPKALETIAADALLGGAFGAAAEGLTLLRDKKLIKLISKNIDDLNVKELAYVGKFAKKDPKGFATLRKSLSEGVYKDKTLQRGFAKMPMRPVKKAAEKSALPYAPKATGKKSNQKVVKGFSRIEKESIANNWVDDIGEAEMYDVKHRVDFLDRIDDMYKEDPEKTIRIAMGKELTGDDIPNSLVYEYVKEKQAIGNPELIKELGHSVKPRQSTAMGQEISFLRGKDVENPVDAAKSIIDERAKAIANKTGGSVDDQVKKVAQKTRETVTRATKKIRPENVVDDAIGSMEVVKTSAEKRLAKRVIGQMKPPKKKKVDLLVNELTRVAKQTLPAKGKRAPKKPIDLIRQMFDRSDEARKTYTAAKKIVLKKFKDRPDILEALAQYEKTAITKPVADKTVTRAVRDEIKDMDLTMREIITQSITDQKTTADDIVRAMTERGFSEEASESFGKIAAESLDTQIKKAKNSALDTMSNAMGKTHATQTFNEKIQKLSNLGALTDDNYLELAKSKLGMDITSGEAGMLDEMAQNILNRKSKLKADMTFDTFKERMEYGLSREDMHEFVQQKVVAANAKTAGEMIRHPFKHKVISNFAGLTKSLKASFDNSVIGRQGWKTLMTHPGVWLKRSAQTFGDFADTLRGRDVIRTTLAEVNSRPNALKGIYKKMKLAIGNIEEAYPTSAPEKIPIFGKFFKASQDTFTGFQYKTRADIADKLLDIAQKSGVNVADKFELEGIGLLVNSLSGRGSLERLGVSGQAAETLNKVFFAPKYLKSNWDILTVHAGDKMSKFARKQAAINTVKVITGSAAVLVTADKIAKAYGMKGVVEWDSRSANFGKIKIGNTRFDVTGGSAPIAILASRFAQQSSKSSVTGKVSELRTGKYGSMDYTDLAYNFIENKLSPVGAVVKNLMKGETFEGDKPNIGNISRDLLVPLPITNWEEMSRDPDSANILLGTLAEVLGISTNTYSRRRKGVRTNTKGSTGSTSSGMDLIKRYGK